MDEENRKFCLLSNRNLTKEYARPEVFRYEELESYQLACDPKLTTADLNALSQDKHSTAVVQKLAVRLKLKNKGSRDIVAIPSPVRTSSFAFRQAWKEARKVVQALEELSGG